MIKKLWMDFETYCDLDIKKVGLYKYIAHESFHPWCMAYAFDDEDIQLWIQNTQFPQKILGAFKNENIKIYAHNAEFEWQVFKKIGYDIPLKKFIDTQALAGTFGYPLNLDKFCKAIGLSDGKDTKGTRLINKLCKLQQKTIKNPSGRWYPNTASQDFEDLYSYCKQDVNIMRKAVKHLPQDKLLPIEHYVWGHTLMQNERGIKIEVLSAYEIRKKLQEFKRQGEVELSNTTGGHVKTGKQIKKIKNFLSDCGLDIPDLAKETVEFYLKKKIPVICRKILNLRKQLAYSSTAKYDKMIAMAGVDNRVRGNLVYYGAHTSRFSGRGLQVHNLPRASIENPEETILHFNTLEIIFCVLLAENNL